MSRITLKDIGFRGHARYPPVPEIGEYYRWSDDHFESVSRREFVVELSHQLLSGAIILPDVSTLGSDATICLNLQVCRPSL